MQVYAVLYDNLGLILIAKKREFNRWWRYGLHDSALVNQAGQFAFPGGKQEKEDDVISAAKREFTEETGIEFPYTSATHQEIRKDYAFVGFKVQSVLKLEEEINPGLEPDPTNLERPKNKNVKDWELGYVSAVSSSVIKEFVGKRTAVSHEAETKIESIKHDAKKRHSQDIDWYAEIAEFLYKVIN